MTIFTVNQNNLYQKYIRKEVLQHYSDGYDALQHGQYFSAAVWGSVFLEAFALEIMKKFNISPSKKDDLNSRIQRIRSDIDKIPDDIPNRFDEIRIMRNRLVHDMGLRKTDIEDDAKRIYSHLDFVLDWYCKNVPFEEKEKEIIEAEMENDLIPVFISTLNPNNERQRFFLTGFMERLKSIGILPVRCEFNFYDGKDPLKVVRDEVSRCKAMIVIGLERSNAYYIKDKEGSLNESIDTHRKYTSGWLHLEAGIANALGKEIFVLCEKEIYSDGIFDRQWNSYPVLEFSHLDENSREFMMFFSYMEAWVKVAKRKEEELAVLN
ncbi:hypothetical protein ACWM35_10395 [Neobacillus sp. K501]